MIAAFSFNASIVLALVLIPLIYPEAMPRQFMAYLMEAPPPSPQPQTKPRIEHATTIESEMRNGQFVAPRIIPPFIKYVGTPEQMPEISAADFADGPLGSGNGIDPFRSHGAHPVVHGPTGPVHIPSTLEAGLLLQKNIPAYPPIARATGTQGTVVLEATISKSGTITNLRVTAGPLMLQQAALEAVKTWRYRPYLLDGNPVEVETTVNVVFTLNR
jgi:protein TonB